MNTFSLYIIFLFGVLLNTIECKRITRDVLFGECYDIKTPVDIDLKVWTRGAWYEIYRYDHEFELGSDCNSQVFFLDEENNAMTIVFNIRKEDGNETLLQGKVDFARLEAEIALNATYPHDSAWSSFDIVATDVNNYAIVYSCWKISDDSSLPEKQERLWILGKTPELSAEIAAQVNSSLVIGDIDLSRYLVRVSQEECP